MARIKNWSKTKENANLIQYRSVKNKIATARNISGSPFVRNAWHVEVKDYDGINSESISVITKTDAKEVILRLLRKYNKG